MCGDHRRRFVHSKKIICLETVVNQLLKCLVFIIEIGDFAGSFPVNKTDIQDLLDAHHNHEGYY